MRFAAKGEEPLVSICLVTYNQEKYIKKAIDSVLEQETDFLCEFIIADDCSTDGTREVLLNYRERFPIQLILQEKNKGAMRNIKDLLAAPAGKYVAFFEGDDYWIDPLKLKKQVSVLEQKPEVVLCYSNAKIYDTLNANSVIYFKEGRKPPIFKDSYEAVSFCPMPTCVIIFRNLLKNFPEWAVNVHAGDYIIVALLCKYGGIYYLDECLGTYVHHYQGLSRKIGLERFYFNDAPYRLNLFDHFDRDIKMLDPIVGNYLNAVDKLFHMGKFKLSIRLFWNKLFLKYVLKSSLKQMKQALKIAIKIHFLLFLSTKKTYIYTQ